MIHDHDDGLQRCAFFWETFHTSHYHTTLLCPPTLLNRKGEKIMRSGHFFVTGAWNEKELISASESRQGLLPRNHLNHFEDSVIGRVRQLDFFSKKILPVFPAANSLEPSYKNTRPSSWHLWGLKTGGPFRHPTTPSQGFLGQLKPHVIPAKGLGLKGGQETRCEPQAFSCGVLNATNLPLALAQLGDEKQINKWIQDTNGYIMV